MKTGSRCKEWIQGTPSILERYFFLSYIVVMASAWRQLKCVEYNSWVTITFVAVVFLSYCFMYTVPARLIVLAAEWTLSRGNIRSFLEKRRIRPIWIVYSLAVLLMATLDVLAFTDYLVYRVDGHHVTDTFVLNLIFRIGGIDAIGADIATKLTFLGIILAYILLQAMLLTAIIRRKRIGQFIAGVLTRSRLVIAMTAIIAMLIWQSVIFGFSNLNGYLPVTEASEAFPLYVPVTFGHIAKKLGYDAPQTHVMRLRINVPKVIAYPLKPIEQAKEHKNYNIVWLLSETWRSDMLDPNIMPQTCQFSKEAVTFRQHYSSGNGTRMAVFGMFYGLYGNYWWGFLRNERGPVFMDVLLANKYQFFMATSSSFKYPEFMQTMFVRLPKEAIHEDNPYPQGWQNDRRNVDRMISFMSERDRNRPFMTFMFFESPHSRYHFPPECAIRKPYLEDFNYTTTDITKVIPLIKNRYINACNHLDSQLGKLVAYLKDTGLLDSTIVVITGDHGEEFMEAGRWGHTSDFTDWQTRVPMVLWVPGEKPRVIDDMTSHLDLPATVLKRLGVTNSPEDYSLGFDMLGDKKREYTVVGDWYNIACIDHQYKAVFPIASSSRDKQEVTTKGDGAVKEPQAYYESARPMLLKMVEEMREFGG